jgi:hypothetical protein
METVYRSSEDYTPKPECILRHILLLCSLLDEIQPCVLRILEQGSQMNVTLNFTHGL